MNYLVIDIETVPNEKLTDDEKPKFNPDDVKLGNIKDPAKIAEKINQAKEEFNINLIKQMSLDPCYCQIVSMSYQRLDSELNEIDTNVMGVHGNEDSSLLEIFNAIWNRSDVLVGWNIKDFDIPVIRMRQIKNGCLNPMFHIPSYSKIRNPYSNELCIDLMNEFSDKMMSLDKAAKILLGKSKSDSGSDIYTYWKNKEFDKIVNHNKEDVSLTTEIFKKLMGC